MRFRYRHGGEGRSRGCGRDLVRARIGSIFVFLHRAVRGGRLRRLCGVGHRRFGRILTCIVAGQGLFGL